MGSTGMAEKQFVIFLKALIKLPPHPLTLASLSRKFVNSTKVEVKEVQRFPIYCAACLRVDTLRQAQIQKSVKLPKFDKLTTRCTKVFRNFEKVGQGWPKPTVAVRRNPLKIPGNKKLPQPQPSIIRTH